MSGARTVIVPDHELRALLEATEALADTQIVVRDESSFVASSIGPTQFCRECFRAGLNGDPIQHSASCVVGQALFGVGSFRSLLSVLNAIAAAFADGDPEANPPVGILASSPREIVRVETGFERNFMTGSEVRKIVYDVAGVDVGEGLCNTHEEAAARLAGVDLEARQ